MNSYEIPLNLDLEIQALEELIAKFRRGEISAQELKAHRVPFGVYEQREPETYMCRIRCSGGIVTPKQLAGVAEIAAQYALDKLHITTRQELQIHYVKLDDLITVIRALEKIGLVTRGGGGNTVRNIAVGEDAGIDPQEAFDVSGYAVALTSRLISEADSWNLPRKFKIAFSGSAKDKGYATITDLGFISRIKDGKKGFKVYIAGGLGAKAAIGQLLFDFIPEEELYNVTKAAKGLFWKYGNRKNKHSARLRFLWKTLGEEEFKKKFQEEYQQVKQQGFKPLALVDLENRPQVSGLTIEAPQDQDGFLLWKKRCLREQKQKGLFSVLLGVELGFINAALAKKLALFFGAFGENSIRMTKEQNFLFRNVPEKYLANVYNFLKSSLPDFNQPVILSRIISCAGASTCQLGICLSRQAVKALISTLKEAKLDWEKLEDFKINVSGCPNSCGQHQAADLGFFGKASRKGDHLYPAYNVAAGAKVADGKTSFAVISGEIAAKDLPQMVKEFLESNQPDLKVILAKYSQVPDFAANKDYYYDWGSDQVFSLAGRRGGECSAGIFDLIELDLQNIKEARKSGLLAPLVFYASRALLITRGVEPKDQAQAFSAFDEHFIQTGLVDASYRELLKIAQAGDDQGLLKRKPEVHNLAQRIELLYEYMDNAFNFKIPESAAPGKPEAVAAAVVKDFRGVGCPMNFVKTKMELAKLESGQILEIWLDDGAPIENVPGSVMAEGHKVISQAKTGNYWIVRIEKK